MRHVYGRGDIGVNPYCALFTGDAVVWITYVIWTDIS